MIYDVVFFLGESETDCKEEKMNKRSDPEPSLRQAPQRVVGPSIELELAAFLDVLCLGDFR